MMFYIELVTPICHYLTQAIMVHGLLSQYFVWFCMRLGVTNKSQILTPGSLVFLLGMYRGLLKNKVAQHYFGDIHYITHRYIPPPPPTHTQRPISASFLVTKTTLKTIFFSPGRGIPNVLAEGGCRVKLTTDQLPTASQAADLYDRENRSTLTRTSVFGRDPFVDATERHRAERRFAEAYPDITVLFEEAVNHNFGPFQNALMHLVHLSS